PARPDAEVRSRVRCGPRHRVGDRGRATLPAAVPGDHARVKDRRGLLFTGMFLAAALSPLGSTMIAVALPSISSELHVPGPALTQWLVASYLIAGVAAM